MPIVHEWRGAFDNAEVLELHAEAFDTRVFDEAEWNWRELVETHSLGWVAGFTPTNGGLIALQEAASPPPR